MNLFAQSGSLPALTFIIVVLFIVAIILFLMIARFISLWFQALVSKTPISLLNIVAMSLRKVPPRIIVNARINLTKAGLKDITTEDLETHYLAGGNVSSVVAALIAASKAGIGLDFRKATAIDLAGRDIVDAVKTSVNPKVIDCPNPNNQNSIVGVSKDGIQLKVRARVTVRTNIGRLVGGATEETIIARVGEGIVSAIGEAQDYKEVLESPERISKLVLKRGLDAGTAFEILSIDIADIDVGDNKGAVLKESEAEARKKVAQAEAEAKRAMGVADEQVMAAKLMEMHGLVPAAIAEALKSGNMGVFDYYKLRNIQSDTDMRENLAGKSRSSTKEVKDNKKKK